MVFMALSNHVLQEANRDNKSKQICISQMDIADPIVLLDKLRAASRGSQLLEMGNTYKAFASLVQGDDDDAKYIMRAKSLISDQDSVECNIPNEIRIAVVIAGMNDVHSELKRQLAGTPKIQLRELTLDDLLQKMMESSGTRSFLPGIVNVARTTEDMWGSLNRWSETPPQRKRSEPGGLDKYGPQKDRGANTGRSARGDRSFKRKTYDPSYATCSFCGNKGHYLRQCEEFNKAKEAFANNQSGADPSGVIKT
jgi:hypothetical protein